MKILIPVSDEDFAQVQIDYVLSHNWKEPTSFFVLNVLHEIYGNAEDSAKSEHHYGEKLINRIVHRLEKGCPKAGLMVGIEKGNASAVILEKAAEWKADVIVLGSHGRTGIGKAVLGSVAYEVLAGSPCQTIIIGMPKRVQQDEGSPKVSLGKLRSR